MRALITGASSGIGREMARLINSECEQLILVGRDEKRLNQLREELSEGTGTEIIVVSTDLMKEENCIRLHRDYPAVDFLINNAGMGDFGEFAETSLEKEWQMIDLNIKAMHTLMKLYLQDMIKRDSGRILNVASIAGFMPGPMMASYYATKAYVVRLSEAVRRELKAGHSRVRISILCPGPVKTNFEVAANIKFNFNGIDAGKVAEYALSHRNRFYIVPTFLFRLSRWIMKVLPTPFISEIIYRLQSRRKG